MSTSSALVERVLPHTPAVVAGERAIVNGLDRAPYLIKDLNSVPKKEAFSSAFNKSYGRPILDAADPGSWKSKMLTLAGNRKALIAATGAGVLAIGGSAALLNLINDSEIAGDAQSAEILRKLQTAAKSLRGQVTGDGNENTVLGADPDEVKRDFVFENEQFALIDNGIAAVGSIDAFRELREAIFAVEDVYIDRYDDLFPSRLYPRGRPR